ncbi:MAG: hypothetical protein V7K88_11910 [Nostoc sp.]|uniref:hypothetical protein n=1 Tax=Nostoc sp. TaxID=1180 RepID=UPI002FF4F4D5
MSTAYANLTTSANDNDNDNNTRTNPSLQAGLVRVLWLSNQKLYHSNCTSDRSHPSKAI